VILKVISKLHQ